MIHYFRHSLERLGLPFGVPTLVGSVAVDVTSSGLLHWLSALGIVVGIVATGGSFGLKVLDYLERRRGTDRARVRAGGFWDEPAGK